MRLRYGSALWSMPATRTTTAMMTSLPLSFLIFAAYHYELNQSRCGIASATRRANTNLSALVGTLYTPTLVSKPIQRFPSKHTITEKQTYPSKAQAPRRLWHLHLP